MNGPALKQGAAGPKRRWPGLLRLVVVALLLYFVGQSLPWQDRLLLERSSPGVGEAVEFVGAIEGDWKAEQIHFVPQRPLDAGWGWPEEWVASGDAGFNVARGQSIYRWPSATPVRGALGTVAEDWRVDWRPSMPSALGGLEPGPVGVAFLLFLLGQFAIVLRWGLLLRAGGCMARAYDVLRLSFLGLFFNLVLPGMTGGDLVKAGMVTRENPLRRAAALASVVVDRVVGLIALALMATVGVFLTRGALAAYQPHMAFALVAFLVGGTLYAHPVTRRALGVERLLRRLPFGKSLASLDQAFMSYRSAPMTVLLAGLLSFFNHGLLVIGLMVLGRSLGVGPEDLALRDWFVVVPAANAFSAIPIAPAGIGVGEAAFKFLFEQQGVDGSLGVAASATFRVCQLLIWLSGGLFLLLPGRRAALEALESQGDPSRSSGPVPEKEPETYPSS